MTKANKILIAAFVLFIGACTVESAMKPIPSTGKIASKGSAMYALAGEFKTVAANLLWIKADAYHHEFLSKNSDWSANKELIGLISLIVDLDPHFEEAYASGVYIYLNGYKNPDRALEFLKEGLQNNPDSSDLNRQAALFYAIELKDYHTAMAFAKKSYFCCKDDFDRKVVRKLINTLNEKIQENEKESFAMNPSK